MGKNKIIFIKQDELVESLMPEYLKENYTIIKTEPGPASVTTIKDNPDVSIILVYVSDDRESKMALEALNEAAVFKRFPVIAYSESRNLDIARVCFTYGILDYIHQPYNEPILKSKLQNYIEKNKVRRAYELKIKSQNETMNKQYKLLKLQADKLQKSNNSIIEILGTVIECRNLENGDHVKRVKAFTKILATHMMELYPGTGLTQKKIEVISSASALHDIGKVAIPDSILLKPGKLTNDEFALMKGHTIRGAEIVNQIKDLWDEEYAKECYEICRYHHERYDGKGYPDGLSGDRIPVGASCVSLADVYDVLVTERVYKAAYSPEEAYTMIISGDCGIFAPKLLECFKKSKGEFEALLTDREAADNK